MSYTLQTIFLESDQAIEEIGISKGNKLPGNLILDRLIATILIFNDNPEMFNANERSIIENKKFSDVYQSEINKAILQGIENLRNIIIGPSYMNPRYKNPEKTVLESIFYLSNNDIKSIAFKNGQQLSGNHIVDRMIATILLFNEDPSKFAPEDYEVIRNKRFVDSYQSVIKESYKNAFIKINDMLGNVSQDVSSLNIKNDSLTKWVFIPPSIPQIGIQLKQMKIVKQSSEINEEIPVEPKFTKIMNESKTHNKPVEKLGQVLAGVVLSISGTIEGFTRKSFSDLVTKNGGVVSASITNKVNYLVTTPDEIAKNTAKVKKAESNGLPLVTANFIIDSINKGKLQDPKEYDAVA